MEKAYCEKPPEISCAAECKEGKCGFCEKGFLRGTPLPEGIKISDADYRKYVQAALKANQFRKI